MTLQTCGLMDGRGYHNIPAFSSKSTGIKTNIDFRNGGLESKCPNIN